MKYKIELKGEHGERIIVGTARNAESIQEVIAKANRMKDVLEAPDRVDKPMLYVPGGWLSKSDES